MTHDTPPFHEEAPGTETPSLPEEAVGETDELKETKDQLLRALAEIENIRRRANREKEETAKYAIVQFARDILTIGDNLQRALAATPSDKTSLAQEFQQFLSGMEMTHREFQNVLQRFHIEEIAPMHESFDPGFHQAICEIETAEYPAGTVVQLIQAGYRIHDRLMRPALVGVAKPAKTPPQQDLQQEEPPQQAHPHDGHILDVKA